MHNFKQKTPINWRFLFVMAIPISLLQYTMMIDFLGKLFGSPAKVKLMRLFIFNPGEVFTLLDASKRANLTSQTSRREITTLINAEFIKRKSFYRQVTKKHRGKTLIKKVRLSGFIFKQDFPFKNQFENILMEATPFRGNSLVRRLSRSGKMKLIVASGIFIQDQDSRLDLLLVGNKLNKTTLDRTVKTLEGEIGRELRYAVFDTPDFNYRISVYDRLVRDVLDNPHQKLLDKMKIGTED